MAAAGAAVSINNLSAASKYWRISLSEYFFIILSSIFYCELQPGKNCFNGASQSEHVAYGKADLVTKIKAKVAAADPKVAKELGGVFLFNIIKGTSVYSWTLDLNNVTVYEGEPEDDPDCTFTLNENIFKQLVQGREDARTIMQAGRCSVTGDIMRAMKLEPYIKID